MYIWTGYNIGIRHSGVHYYHTFNVTIFFTLTKKTIWLITRDIYWNN